MRVLSAFDLCGKVCGVVGTGRIGAVVARILHGFGSQLLGFDLKPNDDVTRELGVRYTDVATIYAEADIITLHIPLTPTSHHLIDAAAFAQMKPGVLLINTGRGALLDSRALIDALKRGQVGAAGLDVYEEEEGIFFRNLSDQVLQDDVLVSDADVTSQVHRPPMAVAGGYTGNRYVTACAFAAQ